MRYNTRLLIASFLLYRQSKAVADCSKTITVNSQQDLDGIQGCEIFNGDIQIGSQASGDLEIRGLKTIGGNLTNDASAELTSLSSADVTSIRNVHLKGLNRLKTMHFPALKDAGLFALNSLPALETIESQLTELLELDFQDLPRLQQFQVSNGYLQTGGNSQGLPVGGAQVHNVGLPSMDFLFNSSTWNNLISVSGISNVSNITWRLDDIVKADIQGNGNLSITFMFDFADKDQRVDVTVRELVLSGIRQLSSKTPDYRTTNWGFTVGNFTLQKSNVEVLDMPFRKMTSLLIDSNPHLTTVKGEPFSSLVLSSVTILDNENLKMAAPPSAISSSDESVGWTWPYFIQSMVIRGPVTNSFFDYILEGNRQAVHNLNVTSSADGFDCEPLRKALGRNIPGELVCQGKRSSSAISMHSSNLFVVVIVAVAAGMASDLHGTGLAGLL